MSINDTISIVIGYSLLIISEILPFINFPANGVLDILSKGFTNSFSSPSKDIEFAQSLVSDKSLASIVNNISINPQMQTIVNNLMSNPSSIPAIYSVQNNKDITNVVNILNTNPQLQTFITTLLSNHQMYNGILLLVNNPKLYNTLTTLESNDSLSKGLTLLNTNPYLVQALNMPNIIENINQLMQNPQLSIILSKLTSFDLINKVNNIL